MVRCIQYVIHTEWGLLKFCKFKEFSTSLLLGVYESKEMSYLAAGNNSFFTVQRNSPAVGQGTTKKGGGVDGYL
jgi:hypothetical protein